MNVKEILTEYMSLNVVKGVDGFFKLAFKNPGYYCNFYIKSILNHIGLPEKDIYLNLLESVGIKCPLSDYLTLNDHSLCANGDKILFDTDGLSHTNVIHDLKQYKVDFDLWLNGYLDEISPKLQKKIDDLAPKDFTVDDMYIILNNNEAK